MCDPPSPQKKNLPLPPRIYPLFNKCICDPPRIYLSVSEYTPLFNKCICATLPESTPLSQNIRPFSTNVYVRPSQNIPLSLNIYTPFQQMYMCDPPGIYPLPFHQLYATLSESTPPYQNIPPFSTNVYVRPSQNLPLLSEYTPFSTTMCNPSRIYPSLLEYTVTSRLLT